MRESLPRTIDLPPVWLVAAMALAWMTGRVLPATVFDGPALDIAGSVLIGAGVVVMVWCAILFRRKKTSIIPHNIPDAMVMDGPYRLSRNPIYLADAVILFGWILIVGSPVALILLPVFVAVINRRFIAGEEAALRQAFGAAFTEWSGKVRRWL